MKNKMHILRVGQPASIREVEFKIKAVSRSKVLQIYREEDLEEGAPGPGYEQLAALINPIVGGELEHVSVLWNDRPADMFVHETGVLEGLPRNVEATAIYRANWLKLHPRWNPEALNWIAGTAVVFEQRVWF